MKSSLVHTSLTSILALGAALVVATACSSDPMKSPSSAASHSNSQPDETAPITDPPIPPPVTANPLKGAKLFVDPEANVMLRANSLRKADPEKAAQLDKIAKQPQALWMGDWNSNIFRAAQHFVDRAQ